MTKVPATFEPNQGWTGLLGLSAATLPVSIPCRLEISRDFRGYPSARGKGTVMSPSRGPMSGHPGADLAMRLFYEQA